MMIKLTQGNILLNAQAPDKTEAIRIAGNLLVDAGNMQPGYIDSMLLREKVANTYLGNGIAIPHGLPRDRDLILRTGISVSQFPDGVQWHQGETVYLVVAIAALGMKTSFHELARMGWRPLALIVIETVWIAAFVLAVVVFSR